MRRLLFCLLLAGCTSTPPAREMLPVAHVTCLGPQGPILDVYMTRGQFERIELHQLPCFVEWGESFPTAPKPSALPTPEPAAT